MKFLLFILLTVMSTSCSEVVDPNNAKQEVFVADWAIGKWQYLDDKGVKTVVTLYPDGSALGSDQSIGSWFFVDNEIHIVWTNGWQDLIRKGIDYQKLGFAPGVATTDFPTNRSEALKLSKDDLPKK